MSKLTVHYTHPADGKPFVQPFKPRTFAEEFSNLPAGWPGDWLATDFSYVWEPDCSLTVIETVFTFKELRSIDTGITPELVRAIESTDSVTFPAGSSPRLRVGDGPELQRCPR